MTHSPVWFDGEVYVTLVAHVIGENELIDPSDGCPISGLLEYGLYPGEGVLRVYDPDDYEMYDQRHVNLSAKPYRAAWLHGSKVDDRYFDAIKLYEEAQKNDLVREALS